MLLFIPFWLKKAKMKQKLLPVKTDWAKYMEPYPLTFHEKGYFLSNDQFYVTTKNWYAKGLSQIAIQSFLKYAISTDVYIGVL